MLQALHDIFLPRRFFTGSPRERCRSLLAHMLLGVAACSLLFYFLPHPAYDPLVHVLGTVGYVCGLLLLGVGVPSVWVVHGTLAWSVGYVVYLAAITGGIHSPAMVWMTAAVLPAVLLLDRLAVLFWGMVVLSMHVLLFVISTSGAVDLDRASSHDSIAWALANQLLVMGLAMSVVFVTERMHANQEAEIEQSNAALEQTHQALLRAQSHKDEFMASVGHELRTPMNAILGLNGILRAELSTRPDDVAVVDHIRRSTECLLQVVNDILDFSQLQAGRLTLHEDAFLLSEALATVVASFDADAKTKNIRLHLDTSQVDGQWVKGDRQRLSQILTKLLNNALKFTAAGHVHVRAQVTSKGVLFEVQDTGIGVAKDRQQQIFHGFEHADAQTNRRYGGAGLGLSICEHLVRLQGGEMGVISALGHGAKFWFELPWQTSTTPTLAANDMGAQHWREQHFRLLLVDDNAVNQLVARMLLQKCFPKAEVVEASNGLTALEKLKTQRFDLVLMDVVMPDLDGMQVTRTLRHDLPAPASQLPVLALTASVNPVDTERCFAAGMNDVLHKPLEEQVLMAKIAQALSSRVSDKARVV